MTRIPRRIVSCILSEAVVATAATIYYDTENILLAAPINDLIANHEWEGICSSDQKEESEIVSNLQKRTNGHEASRAQRVYVNNNSRKIYNHLRQTYKAASGAQHAYCEPFAANLEGSMPLVDSDVSFNVSSKFNVFDKFTGNIYDVSTGEYFDVDTREHLG